MRLVALGFFVLNLVSKPSFGQTNGLRKEMPLFILPSTRLRDDSAPANISRPSERSDWDPKSQGVPEDFGVVDTNSLVATAVSVTNLLLVTSSGMNDFEAGVYARLINQGYLTNPSRLARPVFAQVLDEIFSPEVIHYGRVDASCSILTALKRKNPLCLLDPIFFQLSW